MGPYWWIDHVSTIASIPLAIIGFSVTVWQLGKTRNAANAAKNASEMVRQQFSNNSIIFILPQLQRIEDEIDRAVEVDGKLVATWLSTWRWQASQLRGHLESMAIDTSKLQKSLQSSISAAARAKSDLSSSGHRDVAVTAKRARDAIAVVTGELGSLAALQLTQAENGDDNA